MDDEDITLGNTKALRKDIKRAKTFAIQHLTRRIKMVKNKRGTEQQVEKNKRKAARFEEELECIKELDIEAVIRKVQNNDSSGSTMATVDDVQERALTRLIMSKPIQDHLNTTSPKTKPSIKNQAVTPDKKASSKFKGKQRNRSLSTTSPLAPCTANIDNSTKSDDIDLERTATSLFVDSLSSVTNRDQRTTRQNSKSGRQKANNFKNKPGYDKTSRKEGKKSSNRMGQRARQSPPDNYDSAWDRLQERLWKEQYGRKAKHINSDDKTATTKHRKLKKNENLKPRERLKTSKGTKRKDEETTSHPSWEASKRRKLQQNISQTKFQGQKITFDDSD